MKSGYTKEMYNAEIKAWEKEHGKVKYLNPVSMPKWVRGGSYEEKIKE